MILQVGGSIRVAPEDEGRAAQWLCDDLGQMPAALDPVPEQVPVTASASSMDVTDRAEDADFAGTSRPSRADQRRRGHDRGLASCAAAQGGGMAASRLASG
ncbi:hypothetical protein [Comamonas testosteroni]|uniref:hypothetical protein n=1 Tax=Comamonas testosteroni TaxID=285 RepID=UPI003AEF1C89